MSITYAHINITALALTLIFAGCLPARSASQLQADEGVAIRLVSEFQERIAKDDELRPWVLNISSGRPHPVRDWIDFAITLDGKRWTEINRSQQDRVLRKLGAEVQAAHASVKPGRRRQINAMLADDTGEMGVIVVLGDYVSYNARR